MPDTAVHSRHWQPKVSLGLKSALNIILVTAFLGIGMVTFSYRTYCAGLEEQKIQQATNVAQTISQLVGADTVEHYYQSGQKDAAYSVIEARIQAVQTANKAELTTVVYPTQEGQVFIFSSGLGSEAFPLGTLMPNEIIDIQFQDYESYREDILAGREVPPMLYDMEDGRVLTVSVPIRAQDGTAHGYVTVDLPMDEIQALQHSFLYRLLRIQLVAAVILMIMSLIAVRHGLALAAMPGVKYREYTLELAPGDWLFVYTDGVAEATRSDGELFGTQRMLDALNQVDPAYPAQLPGHLRSAIDSFVEDAPQFDDITMLSVLYRGGQKAES